MVRIENFIKRVLFQYRTSENLCRNVSADAHARRCKIAPATIQFDTFQMTKQAVAIVCRRALKGALNGGFFYPRRAHETRRRTNKFSRGILDISPGNVILSRYGNFLSLLGCTREGEKASEYAIAQLSNIPRPRVESEPKTRARNERACVLPRWCVPLSNDDLIARNVKDQRPR